MKSRQRSSPFAPGLRAVFGLLALFAMLMAAGQTFARNRCHVTGRVVDASGKPIPGARVRLTDNHFTEEAVADPDGRCYTRMLPARGYNVQVIANETTYKAGRLYFTDENTRGQVYVFKVGTDALSWRTESAEPARKEREEGE